MTLTLAELKETLTAHQRLMGCDPGSKTIGLALSDRLLMVASPLETIRRTKFTADMARMQALVDEHGVGGFVVGLPVNMDGSEGPRAQSSRTFARNIEQKSGLPACLWDERLSTAAVSRTLREAGATRSKTAKAVDKMAAAYILQGALDAMGHL